MTSAQPGDSRTTTIAIAVITYRRPELLERLLHSLQTQQIAPEWSVRIAVVDNDPGRSAEEVVRRSTGPLEVDYVVEPEPGIPFARTRSIQVTAHDDAVIFVDDDEVAPPGWLRRLVSFWIETGADVVTGPVLGLLPADAPAWARHSDVYTSVGRHRTGTRLAKAYTNNTLVSRSVLDEVTPAFHPAFRYTGSSDLHFFLRVAKAGFTILWNDESIVEETVFIERVTISWMVRRAFRAGAGDTISRRLINPGPGSFATCLAFGLGRMANGLLLLVAGIVQPAARIKELRRLVSGVGSLAGLLGINHAEYKR